MKTQDRVKMFLFLCLHQYMTPLTAMKNYSVHWGEYFEEIGQLINFDELFKNLSTLSPSVKYL